MTLTYYTDRSHIHARVYSSSHTSVAPPHACNGEQQIRTGKAQTGRGVGTVGAKQEPRRWYRCGTARRIRCPPFPEVRSYFFVCCFSESFPSQSKRDHSAASGKGFIAHNPSSYTPTSYVAYAPREGSDSRSYALRAFRKVGKLMRPKALEDHPLSADTIFFGFERSAQPTTPRSSETYYSRHMPPLSPRLDVVAANTTYRMTRAVRERRCRGAASIPVVPSSCRELLF